MRVRRALWGYDPRDVLKAESLYQLEKLILARKATKREKQMSDEREVLTVRIERLTAERDQLLAREQQIIQRIGDQERK